MIWTILATGIFNILMGLIMKTENLASSILFKVIPFFLGLSCLVYTLKELNII